jgi:hypothetical protein
MQCVRCLADTAGKIADAPDGSKAWEVYFCERCDYVWRSTEEPEIVDISLRDPFFQLDKRDLSKIAPNNVITPRKK